MDYRGEWKLILTNITAGEGFNMFPYKVGDRVAQIYFSPVHEINFIVEDILSDTLRGHGGFGSTGI